MGQFDNWGNRKIRQAMWVKKQREKEAAIKKESQKQYEIRNWAKLNPDNAKYDNDGNPVKED